RRAWDVLAEECPFAEHGAWRELDARVRRLDDRLPFLEHEQSGSRRAVLDQHLTGGSLELRGVRRNLGERRLVKACEQRLCAQPLDQRLLPESRKPEPAERT